MKWGLVGASTIASEHVIGAIRANGHEVLSVLSSDGARGADYAARHGIPQSTRISTRCSLSQRSSAVYISTTNQKHHPQAMEAIAAGKHVLCEKPLAMTLDEAVEMVRAAEAKGVTFATNHHLRNAGSHLAIRDLIAARAPGSYSERARLPCGAPAASSPGLADQRRHRGRGSDPGHRRA